MKELANYIREINDFPKEGIQFKDIATLLQDPKGVELCLENLMKLIDNEKIDKVVGIESRGFFFGTLLAQKLNAGFVPVRKPGKLPYKTISETYDLEYGTDVVEIHIDAIKKGERVLIHDDVLLYLPTLFLLRIHYVGILLEVFLIRTLTKSSDEDPNPPLIFLK